MDFRCNLNLRAKLNALSQRHVKVPELVARVGRRATRDEAKSVLRWQGTPAAPHPT